MGPAAGRAWKQRTGTEPAGQGDPYETEEKSWFVHKSAGRGFCRLRHICHGVAANADQPKKEEQAQLQAQVEEQALRNAETKALVESDNSDEYVARIAREKLGYVSPGERVFVDISSK